MERKWWTLVTVCVATFMLLLDITIVNVALPAIERALKANFSDLQWVVDAYALGLATCVLTGGALADLYGRKRLFLIGVVLFTVASAACGAANDPLFLIIARGIQGLGGALMFATALALLSQEFHGRERGTAFGLWGATIGAAVAVGPLAGGMLTSWLSWRWIFFVNIPIGIGAVLLGSAKLHESKDPEQARLDPPGPDHADRRAALPDPGTDRGKQAGLDEHRDHRPLRRSDRPARGCSSPPRRRSA